MKTIFFARALVWGLGMLIAGRTGMWLHELTHVYFINRYGGRAQVRTSRLGGIYASGEFDLNKHGIRRYQIILVGLAPSIIGLPVSALVVVSMLLGVTLVQSLFILVLVVFFLVAYSVPSVSDWRTAKQALQ